MLTRRKFEEAKYFCGKLSEAKSDDEFYFYLSAFLNAWRSILDVMLYDLAEYYCLGFSREDELGDKEFTAVANALKRVEALKFIEWWRQKQGTLRSNPLWMKRNIIFHRGYPKISEYRIYASGSGGTSGTISVVPYMKPVIYPSPSSVNVTDPTNYYFSDIQDRTVMNHCYETLKAIEKIIAEAEQTFSVKL
jgi:hypothetical protein